MTCDAFDRWLDLGAPADGAARAHAHAASCPRCAEVLSLDQALERALSAPPPPAPAGFTDRVMARIATAPRGVLVEPPVLPWWTRVALEPVTVLALTIAGGVMWGWQGLWAVAAASRAVIVHEVQDLAPVPGLSASGTLALELALATLIALSSGALFRAAGRLAGRIR
jgi:hypothetical protein